MTTWYEAKNPPEEGVVVVGWWGPVAVATAVYRSRKWRVPGALNEEYLVPPLYWARSVKVGSVEELYPCVSDCA
jgi:hypothetical protein